MFLLTNNHTQTSVVTKATSRVCRKCGTIAKSGKRSCCARGGSWYKNCGAAGSTNVDHRWYEGIRACKARAQSKTVIGQLLNIVERKVNNSSTYMSTANTNYMSTPTSIISQGCKTLWTSVIHTSLVLMMLGYI